MKYIISDIDDVVRNLRKKIENDLNLFYKNNDWGIYEYHNPKIRDYFNWYNKQHFYHNLFDDPIINEEIKKFYLDILKNEKCEINKNKSDRYFIAQRYKFDSKRIFNWIFF